MKDGYEGGNRASAFHEAPNATLAPPSVGAPVQSQSFTGPSPGNADNNLAVKDEAKEIEQEDKITEKAVKEEDETERMEKELALRKAQNSADARKRLARPPLLPYQDGEPQYSVSLFPNANKYCIGPNGSIVAAAQRHFTNVLFRRGPSLRDKELMEKDSSYKPANLFLLAEPFDEQSYDKWTNTIREDTKLELERAHKALRGWRYDCTDSTEPKSVELNSYIASYFGLTEEYREIVEALVGLVESRRKLEKLQEEEGLDLRSA
jgi:hypothetical protein